MTASFKWPSSDQMIAGIASGGLSTCILHPLDLVKTQFQVNSSSRSRLSRQPYLYTFRYLRDLYVDYGLRRGLYQGLSANLAGSTASWGLYFCLYEWMKDFLIDGENNRKFAPQNYFLPSSAAAAITVIFTNPLWMIKTRLCMQIPGQAGNYHGLIDAFSKISRNEGIRGLYRGLIPGLVGVSHGAVQFMFYEEFKQLLDRKPSTAEYLLMSSSSKVAAMVATYPYQVVRSRLQVRTDSKFSYSGVLDVISKTTRNEGLWAFYRGIVPSTLRVLPGTCITFLTYERVIGWLKANKTNQA